MLVYHGTVKSRLIDILRQDKIYVSTDYNFAEGYADSKAEDLNDTPVVLEINTARKLYRDPEYIGTGYKSFYIKGPLKVSELGKVMEVGNE